jgi:hypothetical protein
MNRANELNELLDFTWKTEGQKWHSFLFKTRKIVFNMQLEHEIWALTFHTTEDLAVTEEGWYDALTPNVPDFSLKFTSGDNYGDGEGDWTWE